MGTFDINKQQLTPAVLFRTGQMTVMINQRSAGLMDHSGVRDHLVSVLKYLNRSSSVPGTGLGRSSTSIVSLEAFAGEAYTEVMRISPEPEGPNALLLKVIL